jgi:hypothetical protein
MIQKNYENQKLLLKHIEYGSLNHRNDIHSKMHELEELIKKTQTSKIVVPDECVYRLVMMFCTNIKSYNFPDL